ncbi:AraC family transcriptional regulator [Rhodoferax sp. AJA081-3]|uniref:AraC family transcriptional regulator n=1 Tax=Rhodoferax sp. AJA081-3 TaxID=2752316 RepID=UPI001AE02EBE|nr:helix-turn-helix domain-containing protein [Rhodoferax sp. AJA081-3]QTN28519.1 AraC family transcriptional regulator [Rhodoferax sp. AJA081-3]
MCATPTNTLTLGANRALYQGELPATGWHRHASPVLLMGLSGRFALHLPPNGLGGSCVVQTCHSALVDTGVEHVFDPCGEQVVTMYLEPDSPEARSLRPHFAAQGGVIFDPAVAVQSRSSMDAYLRSFDLPSLLQLDCPAMAPLDSRVARSLLVLRQTGGLVAGRDAAAAMAHLSASRFNHLFRAEMGVSFRSYRVWSQVRAAMVALAANPTLTHAALDAGFVDSSHFSRMFRQTFGMTPSSVLKPLKEIARI